MKRTFTHITSVDNGYVEPEEDDDIIITRIEGPKDVIVTKFQPPKDVQITHVTPPLDVFIDNRDTGNDGDTSIEGQHMTVYHSTSGVATWQPLCLTKENISTICPYSKRQMVDPVQNIHCKHTYDREPITHYIQNSKNPRCPISGCKNDRKLVNSDLKDNKELKKHIDDYRRS